MAHPGLSTSEPSLPCYPSSFRFLVMIVNSPNISKGNPTILCCLRFLLDTPQWFILSSAIAVPWGENKLNGGKPPVMGQNPSKPSCSHQNSWELRMFIPQIIILTVIYIYNTIYDICIIQLYRYVLYSIIPPFLAKSSSNQCLGLCRALGFLLPLHLRPYPRSFLLSGG